MNDSLYLEEFGLYDVPTSKTFDKLDEEQPSSSAKHLDEQNFSPNRPHQALEYPPLYFMLRKYPQLLENIKKFYIFRWCTSYPFQKHIPCSSALRKIGVHLTWGETLFLVPFFIAILFAIIFTTLSLSLAGTGHVAQAALIACFILAQRNSLITLLIGMPIDRTLFYHKLSGRVAFLGTLSHTWAFLIQSKSTPKLASMFADPVNASGAVMMTMIIGIILASLPYFRRQTFELFYYVHIICVFGLVCGAFFDTGILVPIIVVSTWGVDISSGRLSWQDTVTQGKRTYEFLAILSSNLVFPKSVASITTLVSTFTYLCLIYLGLNGIRSGLSRAQRWTLLPNIFARREIGLLRFMS